MNLSERIYKEEGPMKIGSKVQEDNAVVGAFIGCRDVLARSIMKMSVKPEDVDDILQETFLRAFVANGKREIRSLQDYLFVISRNLVIKKGTDRSRELSSIVDSVLLELTDSSLDSELHEKLKFQTLSEALGLIPDKHRQAILLRKVYGLSSKEIAKKMGISKSSVDKYIVRGISKCEQILDARGYDIGGEYGRDVLPDAAEDRRSDS